MQIQTLGAKIFGYMKITKWKSLLLTKLWTIHQGAPNTRKLQGKKSFWLHFKILVQPKQFLWMVKKWFQTSFISSYWSKLH
jgi:NADH:ubiquinone oxidoreductase subunit